jgi:Leucine-rich repeat (LRR) protein
LFTSATVTHQTARQTIESLSTVRNTCLHTQTHTSLLAVVGYNNLAEQQVSSVKKKREGKKKMVKLTEEMIIARTRHRHLSEVTQLNCWGAGLTDVSIVQQMTNVEVISLSVNQIDTLKHFEDCKKLKELYVRNNKITDLDEVSSTQSVVEDDSCSAICCLILFQLKYLQNLPQLRCLWLGENPCAQATDYRKRVLETLPKLEKLDDLLVNPGKKETPAMSNKDMEVSCLYQPPAKAAEKEPAVNNNLLSAIIHLVQELDLKSLQVVKTKVDDRVNQLKN